MNPHPEVVERALKLQEGSVLAREVLRLREQLGTVEADVLTRQTMLRGMSVEDGAAVLDLAPTREVLIAWVLAAREMLGDAPNYVESVVELPAVSMEIGAAGEERYVLTVQRAGRVTPHQARRKAEAQVAALEAEVATYREDLCRVADAMGELSACTTEQLVAAAKAQREVVAAAEAWRRSPVRGSRRGAARNRLNAALDAAAGREATERRTGA